MYTSGKRVSTFIGTLRHDFTIRSKWFYNRFMVCNREKNHLCCQVLMIHCKPGWYVVTKFLKKIQEKLLGVTLDNKVNFATHLLNTTKNASKFNALT